MYSSSMEKWNAGVRIFLRWSHFLPVNVSGWFSKLYCIAQREIQVTFHIPLLNKSPSFNQWLNILYSYDLVICFGLLKIVFERNNFMKVLRFDFKFFVWVKISQWELHQYYFPVNSNILLIILRPRFVEIYSKIFKLSNSNKFVQKSLFETLTWYFTIWND